MANYKQSTMAYFDQKGIKYQDVREDVLRVGYIGENIKQIEVFIIFDSEGGNDVELRTSVLASFKDDKLQQGLVLCNQLNDQYRWIKFVIDDEGDLVVKMDALVDIETVGDEVWELVGRTISIVDRGYPTIMKVLWG